MVAGVECVAAGAVAGTILARNRRAPLQTCARETLAEQTSRDGAALDIELRERERKSNPKRRQARETPHDVGFVSVCVNKKLFQ